MFQSTRTERRLVFVGNVRSHFVTTHYLDGLTMDVDDFGVIERWWLGLPVGPEDGYGPIHLTIFLETPRRTRGRE